LAVGATQLGTIERFWIYDFGFWIYEGLILIVNPKSKIALSFALCSQANFEKPRRYAIISPLDRFGV